MVLNFVFKIYLSYHISKEDIGLFWTFLDVVSVGVMLFSGFRDSLVISYDRNDFKKIFFWYSLSFVLLACVVLIFEIFYYESLGFSYPLYYLIILFLANIMMIFFSYLNIAYKNYSVMLLENMVMAVGLVVGFFFFSIFFEPIKSLFFGFLLSFVLRSLYIVLFAKFRFEYEKSNFIDVKDFFKNTIFSGGMYFFSGLFISMSGIIVLKLFHDNTILAEYQVVVRSIFFSLVAVFVFPLNTFTFAQISKFISSGEVFEVKRVEEKLVKYLIVFFMMLLVATFFTKYIIGLVFPIEYAKSYEMLNLMLPLLPFIAYTTFALNIIKAYDRFDLALKVRVVGSVVFFATIYTFYLLGFDARSVVYSLDSSFFMMFLLSYNYKNILLKG